MNLAQFIHDAAINGRGVRRAARRARRLLLTVADPTVSSRVGQAELLMPLSHHLPMLLSDVDGYLANFSRIIRTASKFWPQLRVVDIGANIGDTLALIRQQNADAAVLCIEGNPRYFSYLVRNAARFPNGVFLDRRYVGTGNPFAGRLTEATGTARLESRAEEGGVPTSTLSEIVSSHARFGNPDLVKIDTDGFDSLIIDASIEWLDQTGPVLFAEVDAALALSAGGDWPATLALLTQHGYTDSIWWNNQGRMICRCALADRSRVAELLHFLPGGGDQYSDVLFARPSHAEFVSAVSDGELRCL